MFLQSSRRKSTLPTHSLWFFSTKFRSFVLSKKWNLRRSMHAASSERGRNENRTLHPSRYPRTYTRRNYSRRWRLAPSPTRNARGRIKEEWGCKGRIQAATALPIQVGVWRHVPATVIDHVKPRSAAERCPGEHAVADHCRCKAKDKTERSVDDQ